MICKHCQKEFNPNDKVGFSTPNGDVLQVITECSSCGEHYFMFIEPSEWTPDNDVKVPAVSEVAASRMARPKSIKSRRAVS
jgi:hypothetical protein